ncbi:MAG: hypothetical protein OEV12_02660 [Gammaproteobacteria bacterium]|nr:hypothetical protein [Gammaproteobacteria bacterium]MDH3887601.1 hypothetical protein [Gammaproteobacteria bacterium]MDH3933738.1 hypothetical protein [Gammaproteobacteria bacterium]MDH3985298.1 hypothetical protein [Gammaproteobacteria bacterium]
MTDINTLTEFLGWCSVINVSVLFLSTIALAVARKPVSGIHSKIFGVSESDLPLTYMQYLGNYKIAIIVLNIVPYIALKITS